MISMLLAQIQNQQTKLGKKKEEEDDGKLKEKHLQQSCVLKMLHASYALLSRQLTFNKYKYTSNHLSENGKIHRKKM